MRGSITCTSKTLPSPVSAVLLEHHAPVDKSFVDVVELGCGGGVVPNGPNPIHHHLHHAAQACQDCCAGRVTEIMLPVPREFICAASAQSSMQASMHAGVVCVVHITEVSLVVWDTNRLHLL
jgi:hypothetical protein